MSIGGLGAALLLLVLLRGVEELLPWALGVLGVIYAIVILTRHSGVDEGAPLVGAGLLLCGELAAWSLEERPPIRAEHAVVFARSTAVAALAIAGVAVSGIVVAVAAAPFGGGLAWTSLGALAVVLIVAIVARLR